MSKLVLTAFLVGLITFVWYRWSDESARHGLVDLASGNKIMVVNVLSPEQYRDCHIKNSINVPFEQLESFADKIESDVELVFYCSNYMCTASGAAAKLFQAKGFKRVWAYEAGLADWYQNHLPVDGACKAAYLKNPNVPVDLRDEGFATISTKELKEKLGM